MGLFTQPICRVSLCSLDYQKSQFEPETRLLISEFSGSHCSFQ